MKSNKFRLISSIFCLVAAIALATFAVFAWFTTNTTAKTKGFPVETTSGDISFTVETFEAEIDPNDSTKYIQGKDITTKMEDYSPSSTNSTAVILVFDIKISEQAKDKTFKLTASNKSDKVIWYNNDDSADANSYISNAVYFRELDEAGNEYTFVKGSEPFTFFGQTENSRLTFKDSLKTQKYYFLMDYSPENINALYSELLAQFPSRATLNTEIQFDSDITFYAG